jgi:hypothetical protein
MKDEECMCRDCLKGGLSLPDLEIATIAFVILYMITSRSSLRLSSLQDKAILSVVT